MKFGNIDVEQIRPAWGKLYLTDRPTKPNQFNTQIAEQFGYAMGEELLNMMFRAAMKLTNRKYKGGIPVYGIDVGSKDKSVITYARKIDDMIVVDGVVEL